MQPLPADDDDDWINRWNERNEAVQAVLGPTVKPDFVHSFSWKDYVLPGACALTFKSNVSDAILLYMTLGLTQPAESTDPVYPWEFAVRTNDFAEWPIDLLYQLLTQWLCENGDMGFGYHLPLRFFIGRDGQMWASISDVIQNDKLLGAIRSLYLWTDEQRIRFQTSSGEFRLLSVVSLTEDEVRLADDTTPAHVMLLLRRMGIPQACDPFRTSALSLPGAMHEWSTIKGMSHDDAFNELQQRK